MAATSGIRAPGLQIRASRGSHFRYSCSWTSDQSITWQPLQVFVLLDFRSEHHVAATSGIRASGLQIRAPRGSHFRYSCSWTSDQGITWQPLQIYSRCSTSDQSITWQPLQVFVLLDFRSEHHMAATSRCSTSDQSITW